MQKLIWIIISLMLVISCSVPRDIIKSPDILPKSHCEGIGKYTIVMDAGMGNWSLLYQPVFQELKKKAKVCLIDRAGYAMNTVSANPRDAKTIAREIQKILQQKGINDHIILVGHSLGGLHIRMFQSMFPEKVVGMVLIDAAHPEQFKRLPRAFHDLLKQQEQSLDKVIKLAQKDYLKYAKGKIPTYGLPENLLDEYYKVTTQPEYYYTMKAEVVAFEKSLEQVKNLNDLGNLPLLVIASKNSMDKNILPGNLKDYPFEEHNKIWFKLQKEQAELSTNSTFIVSNENHYLLIKDNELITNQIVNFINKIGL